LLAIFDRVRQGTTELVLVSGYSGAGKSTLINEVHKPITLQCGYFITGKFDQLRRDIPYAAINQAFQDLIHQILCEPEERLKTWRNRILKSLQSKAQIIIDVIPELEQIIGEQPPVQKLAASDTQTRFYLLFQKFVEVFSQEEHPLVIFLDDLQWADLASLKLIELLVSSREIKHLLVIGTYRGNEVNSTHPLILTLEKNQELVPKCNKIELQPLKLEHISQLISETLLCSINGTKTLAELLFGKTQGNPFFLTQLLKSLYSRNMLVFDYTKCSWQWDITQIQELAITDSVVELMIGILENLDANVQDTLKVAACIGNQFNLELLSHIRGSSRTAIAQELQEATEAGLIIPLSTSYQVPLLFTQEEISSLVLETSSSSASSIFQSIFYRFLHDRIQQAAYCLMSENEKKATHLQIANSLFKGKQNELESYIFDIANQFNEGIELIQDVLEREKLAKLNLHAAKKAKKSAAHDFFLSYLRVAARFLTDDHWMEQYDLMLEIYLEMLEALYLNMEYEEIESVSSSVIGKIRGSLEKATIYETLISSYFARSQPQKVIDAATEILDELDFRLSQNFDENNVKDKVSESLEIFLQEQQSNQFASLVDMSDPYALKAVSLLQQLISATVTTNYPLYVEVIIQQVNICRRHGNPPEAALIYANYGILLISVIGDIRSGNIFGELSIALYENSQRSKLEGLLLHFYYGGIWHWKNHLRSETVQRKLLYGIRRGIDLRENESTGFIIISYYLIRYFGGYALEEVEQDYYDYVEVIEKIGIEYSIHYFKVCGKATLNLTQEYSRQTFLSIGNSEEEENKYLKTWIQLGDAWLPSIAYLVKAISCYIFKNYDQSVCYSHESQKYIKRCASYLPAPQLNFYSSLAILAHSLACEHGQRDELLEQVNENQERMRVLADICPENFQHKYALVEAEKARVLGENWRAEELYEQAIQGSKKYEFIQEEAIAYERAADFYLSIGRIEIGYLYLRNAHYCYTCWGAKAKTKQLEAEYPHLLIKASIQADNRNSLTKTTTTNSNNTLDLAAVIRASQVLAEEIVLDNLLKKLMHIVIENAGAQKGFLILPFSSNARNAENDEWAIEAEGRVNPDEITILRSTPINISSVDRTHQRLFVSTAIINYVIRTKENIVLSNAVCEGKFTRDPYIVSNKPKSILCVPLVNQSKLQGILYLENNLTTGAFTPNCIETLRLLSSQAAISLKNARLYVELEESNRTLEHKVLERTQELSQTVKVLKATQAELEFENELLKSTDSLASFDYQVGGSLEIDNPTYVVRSADRSLYKALLHAEFCYILNPRQMGKSSLIVRMFQLLQSQDYACAVIDLTTIGTSDITPEQWYAGIINNLANSFELHDIFNLFSWWREHQLLSAVQRLGLFVETVLLQAVKKSIVIFIDEIDSIISLKFNLDDFFVLIRSYYNQRSINPAYQRLNFVFSGVATPADLVTNPQKTPFNIGRLIQLEGFKEHEAQPLLRGLSDKVSSPQVILKEVLAWTNGQPFLTQKLCRLIRNTSSYIPAGEEAIWVEQLVRSKIIENWELQDEPQHLRTIRDRLLQNTWRSSLLKLYQQILQQGNIALHGSLEQKELLLSGLVGQQNSNAHGEAPVLVSYNRIYQSVFNQHWLEEALREVDRNYNNF